MFIYKSSFRLTSLFQQFKIEKTVSNHWNIPATSKLFCVFNKNKFRSFSRVSVPSIVRLKLLEYSNDFDSELSVAISPLNSWTLKFCVSSIQAYKCWNIPMI